MGGKIGRLSINHCNMVSHPRHFILGNQLVSNEVPPWTRWKVLVLWHTTLRIPSTLDAV